MEKTGADIVSIDYDFPHVHENALNVHVNKNELF